MMQNLSSGLPEQVVPNAADKAGLPKPNTHIVTILLAVGALLRIVSFFFSDNSGGDAIAHAALVAQWLQHPTLKFVFDVYPPGHFWLIGLFTVAVPDVVLAGRLLSLVLGIASLIVFWKLARLLYGESGGLLSLAVFCLYSLHIGYSTTSSAEVSYLFFLLLAMYFFFVYLHEGSNQLWYLVVAGCFMSVSECIRYEAWIVFGGLVVILALLSQWGSGWRLWQKWVRPVLAFGLSGGAWPAFMMAYSWRTFGDPMHLVTLNRLRVMHTLATGTIPMSHELALTPLVLLIGLSPFGLLGAVYGLAGSFSSRLTGAFGAITIFFAAVQIYEIFSGGLLALARYTITPGAMLALISGYGLERIFCRLTRGRTSPAQIVLWSLLFANLIAVLAMSEVPNRYADTLAPVSPRLRYQTRTAEVGRYLRRHMGPDDAVVIDDYNVESNIVADAAGLPILPGRRAYLAAKKNRIAVRGYISAEHPRYLVYSDRGTVRASLELPPGCSGSQRIDGILFRCVFASPEYRIYELIYE